MLAKNNAKNATWLSVAFSLFNVISKGEEEMEEILNDPNIQVDDIKTENLSCPTCGAYLIFSPKKQCLYCEHCGYEQAIEPNGSVQEISLAEGIAVISNWNDSAKMYSCENCGAKVLLENGETAASCPFCGTPHIIESEELPGLRPNAILPFKQSKEDAEDFALTWAKKKLFAPSNFKKRAAVEGLSGVYAPCFTFDSDTRSTYVGVLGKYYTVTVGSGKDRRTETRVRYFSVSGNYNQFFDDLVYEVSPMINQKIYEKMGSFPLKTAVVYDDKYMSGYCSNYYERDMNSCWEDAKKDIDGIIRKNIVKQYNADVVQSLNVQTIHLNVTYKYVLVPVYVGKFYYKNKLYNFYESGITGKVTGKYPVSPLRVIVAILIGLGLVGLAALFIFLFG